MLAHKMSVSICTDNRLVSHTTVTDEYALALEHFEIDAKQLRDIVTMASNALSFPEAIWRNGSTFVSVSTTLIKSGPKRCLVNELVV